MHKHLGTQRRVVILLILLLPFCIFLRWSDPDIAEENYLLENLQILLLLLACLIHGMGAFRLKSSSLHFVIRASLALVVLAFALRELDISQFGNSEILIAIERDLQFVKIGLGLGILAFLIARSRQVLYFLPELLTDKMLMLSFAGGLMLLLSASFDSNQFQMSETFTRFLEEVLELVAYAVILTASVLDSPEETPKLQR